jgi:hypothetical protein
MTMQSAVAPLPPARPTRLITDPDDRQVLSVNRETDCRTALTRGLKEYLEQLSIEMPGGRQLRFREVKETWAEPVEPAVYPSATVYAVGEGDYDWTVMAPRVARVSTARASGPASDRVLLFVAEYVLDITVEIWCTDPKERMALVAMCEDAFDPVDFMVGFRLELPHYHNIRATYEKKDMAYQDFESNAKQRWRVARFTVNGKVAQVRLSTPIPNARPRIDLVLEGGEVGGVFSKT